MAGFVGFIGVVEAEVHQKADPFHALGLLYRCEDRHFDDGSAHLFFKRMATVNLLLGDWRSAISSLDRAIEYVDADNDLAEYKLKCLIDKGVAYRIVEDLAGSERMCRQAYTPAVKNRGDLLPQVEFKRGNLEADLGLLKPFVACRRRRISALTVQRVTTRELTLNGAPGGSGSTGGVPAYANLVVEKLLGLRFAAKSPKVRRSSARDSSEILGHSYPGTQTRSHGSSRLAGRQAGR